MEVSLMPRPKGSKNKHKTVKVSVDFAAQIAEKYTVQRPGNFRAAWLCHPQLFQRSLSAGHRKNAHGVPGNIKQNRHPALPLGGIGQDACSAMMKKNGER